MFNTIAQKLYWMAGIALSLIAVISTFSVSALSTIGAEIHAIAAYDVPLMKKISAFSENQLRSELFFEKAVLHGTLWLAAKRPSCRKLDKTAREVPGDQALEQSIILMRSSMSNCTSA